MYGVHTRTTGAAGVLRVLGEGDAAFQAIGLHPIQGVFRQGVCVSGAGEGERNKQSEKFPSSLQISILFTVLNGEKRRSGGKEKKTHQKNSQVKKENPNNVNFLFSFTVFNDMLFPFPYVYYLGVERFNILIIFFTSIKHQK